LKSIHVVALKSIRVVALKTTFTLENAILGSLDFKGNNSISLSNVLIQKLETTIRRETNGT